MFRREIRAHAHTSYFLPHIWWQWRYSVLSRSLRNLRHGIDDFDTHRRVLTRQLAGKNNSENFIDTTRTWSGFFHTSPISLSTNISCVVVYILVCRSVEKVEERYSAPSDRTLSTIRNREAVCIPNRKSLNSIASCSSVNMSLWFAAVAVVFIL